MHWVLAVVEVDPGLPTFGRDNFMGYNHFRLVATYPLTPGEAQLMVMRAGTTGSSPLLDDPTEAVPPPLPLLAAAPAATVPPLLGENEGAGTGMLGQQLQHQQLPLLCYVHGYNTPFANSVKSGAIYSRSFAEAVRLVVVFSWPSDPELVSESWLITKVMSDFERQYTHCEQHVRGGYRYIYIHPW